MRTLHYNQLGVGGGPWNGFATIAETYRAFDAADERRNVLLVGPQIELRDRRAGQRPRRATRSSSRSTIGDITQATEAEGARINKFPPLADAPDGDSHPNDFPYFRLAEMYLIKAEALNELGQTAAAIAARQPSSAPAPSSPPQPLAPRCRRRRRATAILNERLFELAGEAKRRQDLIRVGRRTRTRASSRRRSEPYKILFPIPATQIQTNPLLEQNPGY